MKGEKMGEREPDTKMFTTRTGVTVAAAHSASGRCAVLGGNTSHSSGGRITLSLSGGREETTIG